MSDLIAKLQNESCEFNFFQAVSLLEERFISDGIRDPVNSGKIRFEPDHSITFPPNDIAAIKQETEGEVKFMLSFMGLIGVSSPLPVYFSDYLSKYPEKSVPLRDFLTIFNHRMYALFYKAWKKYHFMRNFSAAADDPFTRHVAALAGMASESVVSKDNLRLLAYTGVLAGSSRSASGLKTILSDIFGGIPVEVEQFVPRWAPVRDVKQLGSDARLGISTILGTSIFDRAGKFRIVLGPFKREVYESFLPGTPNITAIRKIAGSYCADPLEFDIKVQLQSVDLVPVVIGADNTRLGETSSLGKSEGKTDIHSILIAA